MKLKELLALNETHPASTEGTIDQAADKIMGRLQDIGSKATVDDNRQLRADVLSKLKAGWEANDVFSFVKNNEAVNPDLDEDTALARMRKLADKYKK